MPVLLEKIGQSTAEHPDGGTLAAFQNAIRSITKGKVATIVGNVDQNGVLTINNAHCDGHDCLRFGETQTVVDIDALMTAGYQLHQQLNNTRSDEVQYSDYQVMMPVGIDIETGLKSLLMACDSSEDGFATAISNLDVQKRGDKYSIQYRVSDDGNLVMIGDLQLPAEKFWDGLQQLGWQ